MSIKVSFVKSLLLTFATNVQKCCCKTMKQYLLVMTYTLSESPIVELQNGWSRAVHLFSVVTCQYVCALREIDISIRPACQ